MLGLPGGPLQASGGKTLYNDVFLFTLWQMTKPVISQQSNTWKNWKF